MKFVLIFGPQAVGKMTVGQSLASQTGFKLFHNHMSIDFVAPFFDYSSPSGKKLVAMIRQGMFEEVARSDLEGFIFTYVWAFDLREDWDYVERLTELFESHGASVYYVELEADYEERLRRNTTENRLLHKPTKRDVARSESDLISTHKSYRLNSNAGEITRTNYLKINNTNLDPEQTAQRIRQHFGL